LPYLAKITDIGAAKLAAAQASGDSESPNPGVFFVARLGFENG